MTFNRDHVWHVGAGLEVPVSAAPEFRGHADRVDPERALVGALSSCHMLTFLTIAARKRLVVDAYEDEAVGVMTKNANGKFHLSTCTLRPRISWGSAPPSPADIAQMHELAHAECFIANSVLTKVVVEPVQD